MEGNPLVDWCAQLHDECFPTSKDNWNGPARSGVSYQTKTKSTSRRRLSITLCDKLPLTQSFEHTSFVVRVKTRTYVLTGGEIWDKRRERNLNQNGTDDRATPQAETLQIWTKTNAWRGDCALPNQLHPHRHVCRRQSPPRMSLSLDKFVTVVKCIKCAFNFQLGSSVNARVHWFG